MTTYVEFRRVGDKPETLASLPDIEVPRENESVFFGGVEAVPDPQEYRVTRVWWHVGYRGIFAIVEVIPK